MIGNVFTATTATGFYQPTSDLDFSAKKHGFIIQMKKREERPANV